MAKKLKNKKGSKLPLMLIRWTDHTSNDGWIDKDDIHKEHLVTVTSIGWLVKEYDDRYVIASGWSSDGDFTCVQTIGKAMVEDTKKLAHTLLT